MGGVPLPPRLDEYRQLGVRRPPWPQRGASSAVGGYSKTIRLRPSRAAVCSSSVSERRRTAARNPVRCPDGQRSELVLQSPARHSGVVSAVAIRAS